MYRHGDIYRQIISLENLFLAWKEFKKGKTKKRDVLEFTMNLEDNIFALYDDLKSNKYQHSNYTSFFVCDPKLRHIHKASVRDRLLHHAIVRVINPIFDKTFIYDSYSSRIGKGTHKAIERLGKFAWKLSRNNTKTVWVLKGDIKKFFDSVDHEILIELVNKKVINKELRELIEQVITSFNNRQGKGIPLGNLTSQLFSNIYLNKLDQFVKRKLRVENYVRYADDFIILSRNKEYLKEILVKIDNFLNSNLSLKLHDRKVTINTYNKGIDFLGYIVFPYYKILRIKTKNRMIVKIKEKKGEMDSKKFKQIISSYLGLLKHCHGYKIKRKISEIVC